MPQIFISYRRADTTKDAGRIYDRLAEEFGQESLFKDVDKIPVGSDFRDILKASIEQSDVMLVLIGSTWLEVNPETGLRRIDDLKDFVRFEVLHGLNLEYIQVIPVIISPARPPTASDLPEPLQKLAYINMAFVRDDPDFHQDMSRLIDELRGIPSYFRPIPTPKKNSCFVQFIKLMVVFIAIIVVILGLLIAGLVLGSQRWDLSFLSAGDEVTEVA